jgi:hypothetical protein
VQPLGNSIFTPPALCKIKHDFMRESGSGTLLRENSSGNIFTGTNTEFILVILPEAAETPSCWL